MTTDGQVWPCGRIIVYGGGALGATLAWDLRNTIKPRSLVFVTTKLPRGPVCVVDEEKKDSPWEIPASLFCQPARLIPTLAANPTRPGETSLVLITVPPQSLPDVTKDLVSLLENWPNQEGNTPPLLVFLNNGLLSLHSLQKIAPETIRLGGAVYRGLAHVGAVRTTDNKHLELGTTVTYTGGQRIDIGLLTSRLPHLPGPSTWASAGRRFVWNWDHNVLQREAIKFFINFSLALFAGNQRQTNGEILKHLNCNVSLISQYSQDFAILMGYPGTGKTLLSGLRATAADTQNNVNSITVARAQGNEAPWASFFATFCEKCLECPDSKAVERLRGLITHYTEA